MELNVPRIRQLEEYIRQSDHYSMKEGANCTAGHLSQMVGHSGWSRDWVAAQLGINQDEAYRLCYWRGQITWDSISKYSAIAMLEHLALTGEVDYAIQTRRVNLSDTNGAGARPENTSASAHIQAMPIASSVNGQEAAKARYNAYALSVLIEATKDHDDPFVQAARKRLNVK